MRTLSFLGIKMPAKLLLLVAVLALTSVSQLVSASGETIGGNTPVTTQVNAASAISGLTINGTGNATVPVKLLVTSGTLAMSTTTGLTFTGSPTGSTLYFSGLRSDVNAALATLTYTRNATGTDTLEVSLVSPGEVFFPSTGHLYEYISSTLTWNSAKTAAEGRTKYGATGYLTTITSQAENDFVSARLSNAGWMGASDAASEGAWKWVTGPENNTQFWQGLGNGSTVGGNYANWNNGEPNDSGGNEDCGQFLAGGSGQWNDLPCTGNTLPGYVVEYGAPGGLPSVAAANIAITTSDTVAPTVPGTPSTTTPTATQKPAWTWSASTDAGVGLASPAYSVQWSQDSTFTTGVSAGTANTATFTQPSNLADGRWYFRVRAADLSGNNSAYSTAGSVVIDTTAPTAPGVTAGSIPTNSTTPTISWTASTDNGTGLNNPAYTVQRSQSATFASGITTVTTNSLTFTAPTLAEGTWYFRVSAADTVGQNSAWSATATFTVDTTAPTAPGAPSTATPTNNQKPAWTWAASTDSGAGLGSPAYTVQWSQSATFASGVSAATAAIASFTQPGNLTDGTWFFRVLASDAAGNNSAYSTAGSVVIDATPAAISNVLANEVGGTGQVITWTTDKLSSSRVEYGPTNTYGSTTAVTNTSPRVASHSVTLSGLIPCTLYHYRIHSIDGLGTTASSNDNTFITTGCSGAATVITHSEQVVDKTSGGTVIHDSGAMTLAVPANFAADNADFQIKQLDPQSSLSSIGKPGSLQLAGAVFDLKAMKDTTTPITTFISPISVTMAYTDTGIAGLRENSLVIWRWDAGAGWQKLNGCVVNTAAQTVTCSTPGFSTFALFGEKMTQAAPATASRPAKIAAPTASPAADTATETVTTAAPAQRNTNPATATYLGSTPSQSKKSAGINPLFIGLALLLCCLWFIIALVRRRRKDGHQAS